MTQRTSTPASAGTALHEPGAEFHPDRRFWAVYASLLIVMFLSAMDLWCGRTHPWEQRREEAQARAEAPEASVQRPEVRLADAVRVMVEAISDVAAHPRAAEAASGASGGPTPSHSPG